ncbi:MAG: UvrD/REP helicase family protein, partial [Harvfovirus sp.]
MLCRIKYLVDRGVVPNKILLLTFNKAAQLHLEKKIRELFGWAVNVCIRTIDSFSCWQCFKYRNVIAGFSETISVREFAPLVAKFM